MINLDTLYLRDRAINIDGCYMAGISNPVESVKIDGVESNYIFYCDVNIGFAIKHKTDLSGKLMIVDEDVLYEIVFGKIEVSVICGKL